MAQVAPERVVNGIKTRILHNKDYVEVNERTRILHELRKAGEIKEFKMLVSAPYEIAGRIVWRVEAEIDGMPYKGNAEVKLDAPKNTPDGTNPFECAETSAFGRMLAFAGLGTVESIASYDEIARNQPGVLVIEAAKAPTVEGTVSVRDEATNGNGHAALNIDTIYKKGIERGTWTKEDFYAVCSALLDKPLSKANARQLEVADLEILDAATEEKAAATSGK